MDLDTEANRIKASVETLDTSVLAVGLNCAKLVKCFQAALEDQGGRNALQSLSHEDRQIVKDCIQDLNRHLLAIKSHETWKDRKKAESQARGLHVLMSADVLAIRSVLKHSKFRDEWKAAWKKHQGGLQPDEQYHDESAASLSHRRKFQPLDRRSVGAF